MYKSLVLLCVVCSVLIEARPQWQYLPDKPGYVPVYIRSGDTPLEDINPYLAEAFHAIPAGRSVGKKVDAVPELPEQADQPQPEIPEPIDTADSPNQKNTLEKIKVLPDITKPVERR